MRIWSLHPKYLDTKGLLALWRETLLAKKVLEHNTKGYKNHPQLDRFKAMNEPVDAINTYLKWVWIEADSRAYSFDKGKFIDVKGQDSIMVTTGQLTFEKQHLLNKLKIRDEGKFKELIAIEEIVIHPLFKVVDGAIESWERP